MSHLLWDPGASLAMPGDAIARSIWKGEEDEDDSSKRVDVTMVTPNHGCGGCTAGEQIGMDGDGDVGSVDGGGFRWFADTPYDSVWWIILTTVLVRWMPT